MNVYCISHEQEVEAEPLIGGEGMGHLLENGVSFYRDEPVDYDFCTFNDGFAYCPPPPALFDEEDIDVDQNAWNIWCEENEPSSNEVFISNLHAYELKADFEGVL